MNFSDSTNVGSGMNRGETNNTTNTNSSNGKQTKPKAKTGELQKKEQ
jgi:hypothetical protein